MAIRARNAAPQSYRFRFIVVRCEVSRHIPQIAPTVKLSPRAIAKMRENPTAATVLVMPATGGQSYHGSQVSQERPPRVHARLLPSTARPPAVRQADSRPARTPGSAG